VMTVDVPSCVTIESIHDVLQFRIQPVHDRVEGHAIFCCEYDQLEIWVANLRKEHVNTGTLLESPSVFVLKIKGQLIMVHKKHNTS
jgi:hypothetical protein